MAEYRPSLTPEGRDGRFSFTTHRRRKWRGPSPALWSKSLQASSVVMSQRSRPMSTRSVPSVIQSPAWSGDFWAATSCKQDRWLNRGCRGLHGARLTGLASGAIVTMAVGFIKHTIDQHKASKG